MRFTRKLIKPLFSLALALALFVAPARAGNDVPLVVDAIKNAQQAPVNGHKWQITAIVSMSSPTQPTQPTMTAKGVVTVSGDSEEAQLGGSLPMTLSGVSGGDHALAFNLKRDGGVGIQRLIAGKAFLGRPMSFYQAIPDPKGEYLSRKIKWNGASRFLLITLSAQQVEVSKGTPPPIRRKRTTPPPIRKMKKEPIGKRYKITGFAHTTNSDDGAADNTVEPQGAISITARVNGKDVTTEVLRGYRGLTPWGKGHKAPLLETTADYIFSDPKSESIRIDGFLEDHDDWKDNDRLWPMIHGVENLKIVRLDFRAGQGNIAIPGDRYEENVEVYFNVTFVEDLY